MVRYLIVEDEGYAYEEMKRMMSKLKPTYQLIGWTKSVVDTVKFLQAYSVDLILLDIRLADGNSFQIFDQIKITTPIIFTTAYDEYAIQAFKQNSVDYLLKPIEETDLLLAINKFEEYRYEDDLKINYDSLLLALNGNVYKNRFLIQRRDTYDYIVVEEIAFFYSEDKVVFLHTNQDKRYIIDYTLDQIEQMLDRKIFFRVSRNCIAHIRSIRSITKFFNSRLKLSFHPECPHEVLVSRVRVPKFLEWIDGVV